MKKLKINSLELIVILINKMLEKHHTNFAEVSDLEEGKICGELWCTFYTFTKQEEKDYKKWFIDYIYKNVSPKMSKSAIEREYLWFNLMWGLKVVDNEE